MNSFTRTLSLFAIITSGLLVSTSGCSQVGEAIDCDQMCDQMKRCLDDDLNVRHCAERCEDRASDNALANKLDACTDCLDHGDSCSEANDCAVCDEVQMALTK
jgi:hypothetical protein